MTIMSVRNMVIPRTKRITLFLATPNDVFHQKENPPLDLNTFTQYLLRKNKSSLKHKTNHKNVHIQTFDTYLFSFG